MNRDRRITERVKYKFLGTLALVFFIFTTMVVGVVTVSVRNMGLECAKGDVGIFIDLLFEELKREDFLYRMREHELEEYFGHIIERYDIQFIRLNYPGNDHSANVRKAFLDKEQVLEYVWSFNEFSIIAHTPYFDDNGYVVGVVSLAFDADKFRDAWVEVVNIVFVLLIFLFLTVCYALKKILHPYVSLYHQLFTTVSKMQKGDFEQSLETPLKDEIGDIARWMNTMRQKIHNVITDIEQRVPLLISYREDRYSHNPLIKIKEIFDELIDVYHLKKQLEHAQSLKEAEDVMIAFFKMLDFDRFRIIEAKRFENRLIYESTGLSVEQYDRIFNTHNLLYHVGDTSLTLQMTQDLQDDFFCIFTESQKGYWVNFKILDNLTWNVLFIFDNKEQFDRFEMTIPYFKNCFDVSRTALQSRYLINIFKEDSQRDPLTQLYNRAFLEEFSKNATLQAERIQIQYAILMVDIDFFKKVNDTYGHNVGDKVLKKLAKSFLAVIRSSDLAVRYGGEEFLILLLNCDQQDALNVAQKIKDHFEAIVFESDENELFSCTLSVGASLFPDDAQSVQLTIKYADLALYKAKQNGRNQIVIFDPSILPKDFDQTKI